MLKLVEIQLKGENSNFEILGIISLDWRGNLGTFLRAFQIISTWTGKCPWRGASFLLLEVFSSPMLDSCPHFHQKLTLVRTTKHLVWSRFWFFQPSMFINAVRCAWSSVLASGVVSVIAATVFCYLDKLAIPDQVVAEVWGHNEHLLSTSHPSLRLWAT